LYLLLPLLIQRSWDRPEAAIASRAPADTSSTTATEKPTEPKGLLRRLARRAESNGSFYKHNPKRFSALIYIYLRSRVLKDCATKRLRELEASSETCGLRGAASFSQ
jgi:hypothetical protein